MLDLHTHSTASDGSMAPAAIVALSAKIGLKAVALTDHDTVAGLDEALEAAAGVKTLFIPGIELSADLSGGTLHIVGLFIDHRHPSMVELLAEAVRMRHDRNLRLVAKLAELRIPVSLEEAEERAGGDIVGRPHFAAKLVEKGFAANAAEVFSKILGRTGSAHVSKERFSPKKCIEAIRGAGGVPILAHPDQTNRKGSDLDGLVAELKALGLVGIEAFCAAYTSQMNHDLGALAKRHGLVRSGGSDFHGAQKPAVRLGRGFGSLRVPDSLLEPLEEAAAAVRAAG